jgi:hypothetical protein
MHGLREMIEDVLRKIEEAQTRIALAQSKTRQLMQRQSVRLEESRKHIELVRIELIR